jgi:hypothetical protein
MYGHRFPGIIPATSFLRGVPGVTFHGDGSVVVDQHFNVSWMCTPPTQSIQVVVGILIVGRVPLIRN